MCYLYHYGFCYDQRRTLCNDRLQRVTVLYKSCNRSNSDDHRHHRRYVQLHSGLNNQQHDRRDHAEYLHTGNLYGNVYHCCIGRLFGIYNHRQRDHYRCTRRDSYL